MKSFSKKLAIFFVVLSLVSSNVATVSGENLSPVVKRIGGENRIMTSVSVSERAFESSENAILVGSRGEIDALGGSLLAKKLNAPIIMTDKASLTPASKLELERLGVKNVFILGGENVVSQRVVEDLNKYNVERIAGYDRVETAIEIAKTAVGENSDEVFLSLGYDIYADALAIGPVTANLNKPLLLSQKTKISDKTLQAIEDLKVKKVTIVGGVNAVSKDIEEKLKIRGLSVDRIYGDNRIETSIKIAEEYFKTPSEVIISNGYIFADSVIGGYFASKINAPIILSRSYALTDETFKYVRKVNKNVNILGLHRAIEKNVETYLNIILKTDTFKDGFFLLPKNNKYDVLEASKMIDRVMGIPPNIVANIYNAGVRVKFCNGPITHEPEYAYLKGQVPRGWEYTGKTWDDVPGAGGTETPIARIGYSNPSTKTGHSACNLELHEIAHTIDNYISGNYYGYEYAISETSKFKKIWKYEAKKILDDPYYVDNNDEYFAETFAMYYLNKNTNELLLRKAPKTHAFMRDLDFYERFRKKL